VSESDIYRQTLTPPHKGGEYYCKMSRIAKIVLTCTSSLVGRRLGGEV